MPLKRAAINPFGPNALSLEAPKLDNQQKEKSKLEQSDSEALSARSTNDKQAIEPETEIDAKTTQPADHKSVHGLSVVKC